MAYCGQCGFKNPDGAKFCGSCGADLSQQEKGNVETIVKESGEASTLQSEAMTYVPLDIPPLENNTTEEAPQPADQPTVQQPVQPVEPPVQPAVQQPVQPTPQPAAQPAPQQPASQQPVQPTPQPAPQPPVPPVAPAPQQVIIQTAPPTPPPTPQAPKSSGCGIKSCLGCGCITVIIITLIIAGLAWWGYSYIKDNPDFREFSEEWEELMNTDKRDWDIDAMEQIQDPMSTTYEGKTLSELAEENNFPSVNFNVTPIDGALYKDKDGNAGVQFNFEEDSDNFEEDNDGNYILVMTVTDLSSGQAVKFYLTSCGCSIYHAVNPNDADMEGYIFVDHDAKRILISDNDEPAELLLSED